MAKHIDGLNESSQYRPNDSCPPWWDGKGQELWGKIKQETPDNAAEFLPAEYTTQTRNSQLLSYHKKEKTLLIYVEIFLRQAKA